MRLRVVVGFRTIAFPPEILNWRVKLRETYRRKREKDRHKFATSFSGRRRLWATLCAESSYLRSAGTRRSQSREETKQGGQQVCQAAAEGDAEVRQSTAKGLEEGKEEKLPVGVTFSTARIDLLEEPQTARIHPPRAVLTLLMTCCACDPIVRTAITMTSTNNTRIMAYSLTP
jgi:hypothetical protein